MEILFKLDQSIIRQFEKAAQAFQKWTGKTNFWIAKQVGIIQVMLIICLAGGLMALVFLYKVREPTIILTLMVLIGLYFFKVSVLVSYILQMEKIESAVYAYLEHGTANPRKIHLTSMFRRLYSLMYMLPLMTLVGFRLHNDTWLGLIVPIITMLDVTWEYLLACDPLPPCSGKIKDLVPSFLRSFCAPQPQGNS